MKLGKITALALAALFFAGTTVVDVEAAAMAEKILRQ